MQPYYQKNGITLYHGDLRDVLPQAMQPNMVDFVVTDPPYGLGFMEKDWDFDVPGPAYWKTIAGVCKPGPCCWPLAAHGPGTGLSARLRMPGGRFVTA